MEQIKYPEEVKEDYRKRVVKLSRIKYYSEISEYLSETINVATNVIYPQFSGHFGE